MTELLLRPEPVASLAPPATLPFISIIVPVRNEERFIGSLLDQLLTQDYCSERMEVLVADGRSTDATREVVLAATAEYPNLYLLDNPRQLSSAGRNVAVRAARGDIVVLIDGHSELGNPRYLRDLAAAFECSEADAVARPQPLDVSAATTMQRAVAAARASRLGHNPDSFIYSSFEGFVKPQSVAVAYRRSVFDRVGFFDETFDACEDVEFNHRLDQAGLRCYFTPRVRVSYHPRATLSGLFRQMIRYGRGRVRLLRKHPTTFSFGCFLPALFVLGVLLGSLVAALSSAIALLYAGTLAVYALAIASTSLSIALKARDLRLLPWLPLAFLAIHFGAGGGILTEAVYGLSAGRRR
jgi:succinoglycan biosynthesis protein ExoA